ncbi:homing endonuclease associated repeat-containing protein [Natronorubrum texcoconense]
MNENDQSRGSAGQDTSGEVSTSSGSRPSTNEPVDLQDRNLIIALVGLAQELGRLPTASDVNERCEYSHQQYREVFGSLVGAYKRAGLIPEDTSEAELTAHTTAQSSNETERERKSASDSSPSSSVSPDQEGGNKREGKVSQPPAASGTLEEPATQEQTKDDDTRSLEVTQGDLVQEIQRFAEIIDEPPTEPLVTAYGEYEPTAYETVFDSWNQALEEAGFDPTDVPDWSNRKYTNTGILDAISNLAEKLGHPPTTTEMNEHGDVTGGIGSLRFGSWANAIRFAGFEPNERPSVQKGTAASSGSHDRSGSPTADSGSSNEATTATSVSTDANTEVESSLEELTTISGVLESDAVALAEAGYTSREALVEASVNDLKEIDGISLQLALRIKADVEE